MKKIFGSLITAAAIWAGSTAFISSQMKPELENYITKSNQLYKANGIELKLSNYKKSFLNSTAEVEITITDPALVELLADTYALPLKMSYNIEHGPIFFQNGLGVGLAKVENSLALSSLFKAEDKKEFLDLIKDDVIIKSNMIISFFKDAHYTMSTSKINIKDENKHLEIAPLEAKGSSNLDTFQGNATFKIPHILLKKDESSDQFKIDNLTMDIDIDEFIENALMLGTINLSIEKLLIKDESNPQLDTINIATRLNMVTQKDGETSIDTQLKGDIDLLDTKLPADFPDLKTVHLEGGASHLGIDGLIQFQKATQEMQEAQTQLVAKMQGNPEEMEKIFEEFGQLQEHMMGKILQALNHLLIKDKTQLNYAAIVTTKDKKTSNTKAQIGYTGNLDFQGNLQEIALKAQQEILNMINLNLDISLDRTHLQALPDAQTLLAQIQMGVAQGFVKEENGKYILNGYYKNKELMVNDNNLTATVLPLLMMATQGGMQ